jgi:hypothetical protein
MPGGWVPTIWDFRPSRNSNTRIYSRVAFISIGSTREADEELEFQPKKVASDIIFSNSQFYYKQQGWISWLMCLEHADTVIYPVSSFPYYDKILLTLVDYENKGYYKQST